MSDRFDLEQMILECWHVTTDIELLNENVIEKDMSTDSISNTLIGIQHIYEMRFNKLWDIFESVVASDYAELRSLREQLKSEQKRK
jgi:hypothetical protein